MEIEHAERGEVAELRRDGAHMAVVTEDERAERGAEAAEECGDRLGVAGEAAVEEEAAKVGEMEDGGGQGGAAVRRVVAGGESGVIRERAERERDDMVDIVGVRHAFDAVPSSAADIGDGGGPGVAGGRHELVDGALFVGVGASLAREAGLGGVDEIGGIRHHYCVFCGGRPEKEEEGKENEGLHFERLGFECGGRGRIYKTVGF